MAIFYLLIIIYKLYFKSCFTPLCFRRMLTYSLLNGVLNIFFAFYFFGYTLRPPTKNKLSKNHLRSVRLLKFIATLKSIYIELIKLNIRRKVILKTWERVKKVKESHTM